MRHFLKTGYLQTSSSLWLPEEFSILGTGGIPNSWTYKSCGWFGAKTCSLAPCWRPLAAHVSKSPLESDFIVLRPSRLNHVWVGRLIIGLMIIGMKMVSDWMDHVIGCRHNWLFQKDGFIIKRACMFRTCSRSIYLAWIIYLSSLTWQMLFSNDWNGSQGFCTICIRILHRAINTWMYHAYEHMYICDIQFTCIYIYTYMCIYAFWILLSRFPNAHPLWLSLPCAIFMNSLVPRPIAVGSNSLLPSTAVFGTPLLLAMQARSTMESCYRSVSFNWEREHKLCRYDGTSRHMQAHALILEGIRVLVHVWLHVISRDWPVVVKYHNHPWPWLTTIQWYPCFNPLTKSRRRLRWLYFVDRIDVWADSYDCLLLHGQHMYTHSMYVYIHPYACIHIYVYVICMYYMLMIAIYDDIQE